MSIVESYVVYLKNDDNCLKGRTEYAHVILFEWDDTVIVKYLLNKNMVVFFNNFSDFTKSLDSKNMILRNISYEISSRQREIHF